jgi:hypothetical protein
MRRLSLNRSEPFKKSGQNIPKNRCRTTIAERMGGNASGTALYRGSGRLLKPRSLCSSAARRSTASLREPDAVNPQVRFDERGVWRRSHGRASEAPPDERGGNRYVRPTATAPHLDSTRCRPSTAPRLPLTVEQSSSGIPEYARRTPAIRAVSVFARRPVFNLGT